MTPGQVGRLPATLLYAVFLSYPHLSIADPTPDATDQVPSRPSIEFNRGQEDWSVLADPNVPREPLDFLKYL